MNTSQDDLEIEEIKTENLYEDIEKRTGGEIYVGVVGPVRTGKSTFIKRFMELFVIPTIESEYILKRTKDELPQASSGKVIMTTEPKFVPNESITVNVTDDISFKVKMIDCVGYLVDGATGYIEGDSERLVNTPWSQKPIPFTEAATIGTEKVIKDHSTIGIVLTTDGTITGIDREAYKVGEKEAITKLKEINKPFIVLLNTLVPESDSAISLARQMEEEYNVRVIPINALLLNREDITRIFEEILYEFPLVEIDIKIPKWVKGLNDDNELKLTLKNNIIKEVKNIEKMQDVYQYVSKIEDENIKSLQVENLNLGKGIGNINLELKDELFYQMLSKETNLDIKNDYELMLTLKEMSKIREKYEKISTALDEVERKGYGVVVPKIEELSIEEPEIIKEGNRYGVKLTAKAPSIHMIEADIKAEVAPIIGTEEQSRDLLNFLVNASQENMSEIWNTNVFGKTLYELVSDELVSKLNKMSDSAKERLGLTLQRVINEGSGNLICIII